MQKIPIKKKKNSERPLYEITEYAFNLTDPIHIHSSYTGEKHNG